MKTSLTMLVSTCFFIFISTAQADFPANNSTRISGDDLKTALIGNVRHCSRSDGRTWDYTFYTDGQLKGENSRGQNDDGTWKISSDGDLCLDWGFEFRDTCQTMYRNPANPKEFAYVGGSSGTFYTCNLKPIN
jgi:hypothetical protein